MSDPWVASHDGSIIITPGVARNLSERYRPIEVRIPRDADRIAIARLITAAPELLAACKEALYELDCANRTFTSLHLDSAIQQLRAAIARAEGGVDDH